MRNSRNFMHAETGSTQPKQARQCSARRTHSYWRSPAGWGHLSTVRLRSCVRAKTKIGLANLTYNMQRMVWLIDQATAACYPRRGSPWLGRARSSSPASPNPYSAAVMKCPGPRNPKLFPPDGLGIRAGGGIPAMGAGGRIELPAMPSCRTRRIKRGARAVPGVTWQ
jgi:hypothetical protein